MQPATDRIRALYQRIGEEVSLGERLQKIFPLAKNTMIYLAFKEGKGQVGRDLQT